MENFKMTNQIFEAVGKNVDQNFKIDDSNIKVVSAMVAWINRDEEELNKHFEGSIDKGWCLIGTVGTGKTVLMKVLNANLIYSKSFLVYKMQSIWEPAFGYAQKGHEALYRYFTGHWFFDELGLVEKETVTYFGNKLNVSATIIQDRHKSFIEKQLLSHFTTNMSLAQVGETYGDMVLSRLKQMCNVVAVLSHDRRLNATTPTIDPKKEVDNSVIGLQNLRKLIEACFQDYLKTGEINAEVSIDVRSYYFKRLEEDGKVSFDNSMKWQIFEQSEPILEKELSDFEEEQKKGQTFSKFEMRDIIPNYWRERQRVIARSLSLEFAFLQLESNEVTQIYNFEGHE